MNKTQPDPLVCEWGGDHRETGKSSCAVCEIPMNLNEAIQKFLHYRDTLEFGKNGSMAYCLRDMAIRQYRETIKLFRKYQAVSEEHPEWHLAQEIFRLRTHFDEVTEDCAKEKHAFTRADPFVDYLLPNHWEEEEETLEKAHGAVFLLYGICCDIVEMYVEFCGPPTQGTEDPDDDLAEIDDKLRKTLDVIELLPESERATALDLTNQCNRMCEGARHVLRKFIREGQPPSTETRQHSEHIGNDRDKAVASAAASADH